MYKQRAKIPLEDRFFSKVEMIPFHSCWEWTGAKNESGYGIIAYDTTNNKLTRAHRISWMIHNGSIPEGMLVCHKCDNPGCVNPHHLFLGNFVDNAKDMMTKGRGRGQLTSYDPRSSRGQNMAIKTHCPLGHEYNEKNTSRRNGSRVCKTCARTRTAAYRAKKKLDKFNL